MVRVNKNLLAKLFWEAEDYELRLAARIRVSELMSDGFAYLTSYTLKPSSNRWIRYLSPSLLQVKRFLLSTGILTCCPSTTPFGLILGPD